MEQNAGIESRVHKPDERNSDNRNCAAGHEGTPVPPVLATPPGYDNHNYRESGEKQPSWPDQNGAPAGKPHPGG